MTTLTRGRRTVDYEYYLGPYESLRPLPLSPLARLPSRCLFLSRYGRINLRGRRRGRLLWTPIAGQPTPLIHYYRFWVVISFDPGNGVVYLVAIFTRDLKAEYAGGGPSVRYFYVIQILCSSLSPSHSPRYRPVVSADDACPLRERSL